MRTLTVATTASVLVIAGGVAVEKIWSQPGANPAGAALAGISTSRSATLLEQERQQMILADSTSKSVRLVGSPAVAQIQVPKPKPKPAPTHSSAAPVENLPPVDPGSAQATAQQLMPSFGFSVSSQFSCLDSLWTRESGWRWNAENATSGAYGIPQALPGSKMASAGSDWMTNPATQIKWGLGYIQSVYSTPCGAWDHEESDGWY